MVILITGTTGFIGKKLCEDWTHRGIEIIQVNRKQVFSSFSFENIDKNEWVADTWIHLAGESKDIQKKGLKSLYNNANVVLTELVFNAFLKDNHATTFIYFSTVKAAAAIVSGVLKEEDEFEVDEPYGSSKRKAEKMLLNINLPPNKRLIILRPTMIYGNNKNGNLFSLYSFVKKGIPYPFAAYSNSKSFLSYNNLIFVLDYIISNPKFKSGIYNVADNETVSTNRIIEIIAKGLNKKPRLLYLPKFLIEGVAKIGTLLHLPINSNKIKKLTCNNIVSNQKLLKEMGTQLPFSTENELEKTFKSFEN